MKKKFSFLTLSMVLIAILASCSNDNDSDLTEETEGEKTKMTITIPQVKTYADANATTDEVKFVKANIFIYNGASLLTHKELLVSDFSASAAGWKTTSPIETTVGSRRILVGLNLPDALRDAVLASGPSAVASFTLGQLSSATNGFAMFSKNVAGNLDFNVTENESTNNFSVTVERMVAKVTVRKASSLNDEVTKIKVTGLSFSLGQTNTKIFPFQSITAGVIKDPNWTSSPVGPTHSIPYAADFVNEFGTNASVNDGAYVALDTETESVLTRKVKYAPENTSEHYRQGEITYASIRAKFYPTKLCVFNSATKQLTESPNSSEVPSMWAVQTAAGEYFYFTDFQQAKDYAQHYIDTNGENTASYSEKYDSGYCYYFNWLDAKDVKNVFATLRNQYYDMRVTKINSIGYPNPEVPNPNIQVPTNTKLTVDVSISNWELISSDETLGAI